MLTRKMGFYEKYIKRAFDIAGSLLALALFCWMYALIAAAVRIKLGSPVLFKQPRPGLIDPKTGEERIFELYKFRTMSNERDQHGKLLPDKERLGKFGKLLRSTSLDELPEAINILKGEMSIVGPRPQLVRDMVFMSDEQRRRHTAKPGLTGLAQVMGRNAITWEEKIAWDLKYIEKISFRRDAKIIWLTIRKAFLHSGSETMDKEIDVTDDYGEWLYKTGRITKEEFDDKMVRAQNMLEKLYP